MHRNEFSRGCRWPSVALFLAAACFHAEAHSPPLLPTTRTEAPAKEWAAKVLLDVSSLKLDAKWLSRRSEKAVAEEKGEGFVRWQVKVDSEDVLQLDRSYLDALLASGTPTDLAPPVDCRITLRRNAVDGTLSTPMDGVESPKVDGDRCSFETRYEEATDAELANGELRPRSETRTAVYLIGDPARPPFRRRPAAPGSVTIARDGSVLLDCRREKDPKAYQVLLAVDKEGNAWFWMRDR